MALRTSTVQTWLVGIAAKNLSKSLGTEVSVGRVGVSFFNKMSVESVLVRDQQKDTILYVGSLKVNITDYFFTRNNNEIKYLELNDALIRLNRRNIKWNYQFLADYFSSNKKDTAANKNSIGLKKLVFNNVRFEQNDYWRGELMHVKVENMQVDVKDADFKKRIINVNEIYINQPVFTIKDFDGLRPDSLIPKSNYAADTGLLLNPADLHLTVKKLKLIDGFFALDNGKDKPVKYFDGEHIYVRQINSEMNNIRLNKDTLRTDMILSAKERSGLILKKLDSRVKVTPRIMEFAKLEVETNKSHFGTYYAMHFKHFNDDFNDYINKVTMVAKINKAQVHTDDIALFAPELKHWNKDCTLSADFKGSVADFTATNMVAVIGNNTLVTGTLGMKGLANIDTTIITLKDGLVKSNFTDLTIFVPPLTTLTDPDLTTLGDFTYKGNYKGTLTDFNTEGTWSTQIGAIATKLSIKIPSQADASYTGNIQTTHFDLGKFLHNKLLGLVDCDGTITGNSFVFDKLKTIFTGNIGLFQFNGYDYTNITTNGTFQKRYFNGEVKVDDPNFNFNSQVEVDMTNKVPRFNILGDLVNSNFKKLNLTNKDLKITGLLDADFAGTNIDNFLGNAKFINAAIEGNNTKLSFDSLSLTTAIKEDSVKYLTMKGNDVTAQLHGKFSILDLPNSFQSFLNHYYPSYIEPPTKVPVNQDFKFEVNTKKIEPYLKLFNKDITGFDSSYLYGALNTVKNNMSFNTFVPYAGFKQYSIKDAHLLGNGNFDSLSLHSDVGNLKVSDSLNFPDVRVNIQSSNDYSAVSIQATGKGAINEADINADVYDKSDGVKIHFKPSSFVLNQKKWTLEKEGEVEIRRDYVSAQNVKFYQGSQQIEMETCKADDGVTNNLVIRLQDVDLGDATSTLFKNPKLSGKTNGSIELNDFYGDFNATANLHETHFKVDSDTIGMVNVTAKYNQSTGLIEFDALSPNPDHDFTVKGSYNVKDSVGMPLNTTAKFNNSKIDFLNNYLSDIFSETNGYVSGTLNIKANSDRTDMLGSLKLTKGGVRVNYTKVYYSIDSTVVKFDEEGIDFGNITLHDTLGNVAHAKGKLYENNFKNMYYDFEVTTNKLLMLNTNFIDNQLFYGNAVGKGTFTLKGPEDYCQISMVATAAGASHIVIPNSINRESSNASYIEYKVKDTSHLNSVKKGPFNFIVDLDITANENVWIDVIMDELAGDVIKATGNGRLKIRAGTTEPFSIRGRYDIDNGSYDFSFQSFIRKPFILKKDAGNYIEWNGDPMGANIHIDAQYVADNISIGDLIANQSGTFSNEARAYRGTVYVIANLRNKLSHPDIGFKIDFPIGGQIKNDPAFTELLSRLEKDDNEMLKQVTYLIVFNSFAPYGEVGGSGGTSLTSLGVNTISQLFVKEINKTLSNLLYKFTKDKSLHLDIGNSVYSSSSLFTQGISATSGSSLLDRNRLNFKIGYNFFNDKVLITFGSDFDFNLTNTTSQTGNFQWLPDLNVEVVLSQDKRLRALIFSKNSLDISGANLGKRNRQGLGISYRKDFEKWFFIK